MIYFMILYYTKDGACIMTEIWKSLKGITKNGENYEISNLGNIRHATTKKTKTPQRDKDGYLFFMLYKNNKGSNAKLHRLIALTFISNPENKPLVNHKDGNKENNNIDNLEWATSAENNKHAWENKLNQGYDKKGENHPSSKLTEKDVLTIRRMYSDGGYTYQKLADAYGVDKSMIGLIIKRKSWKHI